jgi:hypothetical protein
METALLYLKLVADEVLFNEVIINRILVARREGDLHLYHQDPTIIFQ